jgi:hypothetical protein
MQDYYLDKSATPNIHLPPVVHSLQTILLYCRTYKRESKGSIIMSRNIRTRGGKLTKRSGCGRKTHNIRRFVVCGTTASHKVYCSVTGKVSHVNRLNALAAAMLQQARYADTPPLTAYRCPYCGAWHLTKQIRNNSYVISVSVPLPLSSSV